MVSAPHQILVLLSGLLIVSFLVEIVSRRIRIPSVLFLLAMGMVLRVLAEKLAFPLPDMENLLPLLGMTGLVLIVFEASLDLEIRRDRLSLIGKSLFCSLAVLAASTFALAVLFHFHTESPFRHCLINAVPLAVVSSAVAIPSVTALEVRRREFIVYESTFSDILGILLFNLLVSGRQSSWQAMSLSAAGNFGFVLVLSAASVLFLGWMLAKTRTGNKLILLLSILVLVFAGGKWAHLPTLLLVFGLGISLNNAQLVRRSLERLGIRMRDLLWEMRFLKRITGEATFAIRTYFFVVFGLSVTWAGYSGLDAVSLGLAIYLAILAIRYVVLIPITGVPTFPEVFIAPRGLITILLFYSIPADQILPLVSRDVLFTVVLASILGMTIAMRLHGKKGDARDAPASTWPVSEDGIPVPDRRRPVESPPA